MLRDKLYHVKVLLKRFHLIGHTIGFRSQTQKIGPALKTETPSFWSWTKG